MHHISLRSAFLLPALASGVLAVHVLAADWTNAGGNPQRNGITSEICPTGATVAWPYNRPSIIAWQPVISGNRVFLVRQTGFPPSGEPNGSTIVAIDLDTGGELWTRDLPYNSGDWTTWIAGVSNNQVYVSRSGNGASVSARLYALNVANGETVWPSQELIDAGAYDGVVFASNGDPIVASFRTIKRIRATDGTTAWTATRLGSVSGNCGGALGVGAIGQNGVYVADAAAGGTVIKKFNLTTGAFMYASPVMIGFTIQNTPMVGPDNTIYLSRVQNNTVTDFFYAMNDTGSALTIRWSRPAQWTTESEFAATTEGAVYMMGPGNIIEKRAAADGALLASSPAIPADFSQPRMAVDGAGRLYFSNGAFSNGRFYCFSTVGATLMELWSIPVPNINIGGPAIGSRGTLVIAGLSAVTAYRSGCVADFDDGSGTGTPDGGVGIEDLLYYLSVYDLGVVAADVDDGSATGTHDGGVGIEDLLYFLQRYNEGC